MLKLRLPQYSYVVKTDKKGAFGWNNSHVFTTFAVNTFSECKLVTPSEALTLFVSIISTNHVYVYRVRSVDDDVAGDTSPNRNTINALYGRGYASKGCSVTFGNKQQGL